MKYSFLSDVFCNFRATLANYDSMFKAFLQIVHRLSIDRQPIERSIKKSDKPQVKCNLGSCGNLVEHFLGAGFCHDIPRSPLVYPPWRRPRTKVPRQPTTIDRTTNLPVG